MVIATSLCYFRPICRKIKPMPFGWYYQSDYSTVTLHCLWWSINLINQAASIPWVDMMSYMQKYKVLIISAFLQQLGHVFFPHLSSFYFLQKNSSVLTLERQIWETNWTNGPFHGIGRTWDLTTVRKKFSILVGEQVTSCVTDKGLLHNLSF